MHKMFEIILETENHIYKHFGIYTDEIEATKEVAGNGEIIRIKDVTEDYPLSNDKVFHALKQANFGDIEANAIASFLARKYKNII